MKKKKTLKELFTFLDLSIRSYDLIAVKISEENTYLIVKNTRPSEVVNNKLLSPGSYISEYAFSRLIQESIKPLILNDSISDLDDIKEYCRLLAFYGTSSMKSTEESQDEHFKEFHKDIESSTIET